MADRLTWFRLALPALLLLTLCGCTTTVNNNYRTPQDFALHLVQSGVPVTQAQRLSPDPFRATEGLALEIDGQEIGVYKFNRDNDVQKRRIEKIAQEKRVFIIGIPYPVVVRGSFMLLGVEKNPKKEAILKAFETFQ